MIFHNLTLPINKHFLHHKTQSFERGIKIVKKLKSSTSECHLKLLRIALTKTVFKSLNISWYCKLKSKMPPSGFRMRTNANEIEVYRRYIRYIRYIAKEKIRLLTKPDMLNTQGQY